MSSSSYDLRLFGIDLRDVWGDLRRSWQSLHRLPLLAWLTPSTTVRLLQADGRTSWWRDGKLSARASEQTRFVAIELPEERILRRSWVLPAMSDAQTAAAVALELRNNSPFAPDDVVWGYSCRAAAPGGVQVTAVLASRAHIAQYLPQQARRLAGLTAPAQPELWALATGQAPLVIAGFGEGLRERYIRQWRRVGYALLLLVCALLAALAVTPSVQLYLRARDAVAAYDAVQARTVPLAQQREALLRTSERLATVGELLARQVDPLWAMDLLTRALPDNTALLSLQLQGFKANIAGQTSNAAELMQHLGAHAGMRDVRAPSAATRPLGTSKESFTLELTLDPPAAAAAATVATATDAAARLAPMAKPLP